jgi:hypothetical protein
MIEHTFSLVDGVGEKIERRLWRHGITCWDDFFNCEAIPFLSYERKGLIEKILTILKRGLEEKDLDIFTKHLDRTEHWRLFDIFKGETVCMDIETNGLAAGRGGYITMVGLYDGVNYKCLIRGKDLSQENIEREMSAFKYLITFYGSVFDVPYLRAEFPELNLQMLHYDVCIDAKKIGLRGGLKMVEKQLGISRGQEVDGMSGRDAVRLWHMYLSGNTRALDTLIMYNREDTVNLLTIGQYVYDRLRRATGIEQYI